jgi:hypothetical protein
MKVIQFFLFHILLALYDQTGRFDLPIGLLFYPEVQVFYGKKLKSH